MVPANSALRRNDDAFRQNLRSVVDSRPASSRHAHLLRRPPRHSAGASGCSSRPRRHRLWSRFSSPRLCSPIAGALYGPGQSCTLGNSRAMPCGKRRVLPVPRRRHGWRADGACNHSRQRKGTQDFQGASTFHRLILSPRVAQNRCKTERGGHAGVAQRRARARQTVRGRMFNSCPWHFLRQ